MDLSHAALIVVDLQNDFCPPSGSLAIKGGRGIAPLINSLLRLPWRLKVASQDWHPADHVSFLSSHPPDAVKSGNIVSVQNPHNADETALVRLFPDHCVQGTEGAQIIADVDPSQFDHIIRKGQDSRVEMFSAFRDTTFAKPCLSRSNLLGLLLDAEVDDVFIVGLAAEVCVKETALHAVDHGFKTTILSDGTRAVDQTEAALKIYADSLQSRGVRYHSSKDCGLQSR